MNPLKEYELTNLEINWEHVDTSTFAKEGRMPTGRIRIRARRGSDEVAFTRIGTAEQVVALAARALDVLA